MDCQTLQHGAGVGHRSGPWRLAVFLVVTLGNQRAEAVRTDRMDRARAVNERNDRIGHLC